ncbi:hypothetical protein C8D87_105151 [Lentzea atacamensis]|uniref:Uncharacterized protein n=1 Tax=Lentzea atacamensis TaxID=531938 RepID=A0ABX9E913_9PSEU|nr:hypothetical protein [Lentzea atacamensis]RAS64661.1 hypothetical protein C8D87_105151 [Lentzea atacamensis]
MSWVQALATKELEVENGEQSGTISPSTGVSSQWTFTRADGVGFKVQRSADDSTWIIVADTDLNRSKVGSIIERAVNAASRQEFGEVQCYRAELTSDIPGVRELLTSQFMRLMSEKVYIEGRRRLGDIAILTFKPEGPADDNPFHVPRTTISVHMFVPAPCVSPFSDKIATDLIETIRLISTFAMGRPVDWSTAVSVPATEDEARDATEVRFDPAVLTLARNGVPLDIFGLTGTASPEVMQKVRSSLISYDAAIRQTNPDVATILFVAGMEALTIPATEWRRQRPVARFVQAVNELCPNVIDAIIAHLNFGTAFGITLRGGAQKKRKAFLDKVYDLRSTPVHSGPSLFSNPMMAGAQPGTQRVALLSELHYQHVLAYISSPRSSLIGHPEIAPGTAPGLKQ